MTSLVLAVMAVAAAGGLGLVIGAQRTQRVTAARLAVAAERLARGELEPVVADERAPALGELGRLEAALVRLRERLRTTSARLGGSARDWQTELTAISARAEVHATWVAAATTTTGELAALVDAIAVLNARLTAGVGETTGGMEATVASIEQVARGGEAVLRAVEDTSATMETVAASVTSVAATADSLSTAAQEVAAEAAAGGRLLEDSAEKLAGAAERAQQSELAIERLTQRSTEIWTIVKVIESIADQTNLLALNAAIEAARAGDAGRGFAVVADEVRKLAERSMAATHEIGEAIGAAQKDNEAVVRAARSILTDIHDGALQVTHTSRTLAAILASIEQVSAQVGDVQKATQEQSFAATEVMKLVANMTDVVQRVVTATGEQTASSQAVLTSAQAIAGMLVEAGERADAQRAACVALGAALGHIGDALDDSRAGLARLDQASADMIGELDGGGHRPARGVAPVPAPHRPADNGESKRRLHGVP